MVYLAQVQQGEPYRLNLVLLHSQVLKVYLVQIQQTEPFRLNLEEVYSLDHATKTLRKEVVRRLTNETDPSLITLTIT
jgi:hypothetical protein